MRNTLKKLTASTPATILPARSERLMQCLASGDSFEVIKAEREVTIAKCVKAPLLVNQKEDETALIKSIFLILKRFNDLVNVGKKMNEDQMIALSADLFDRFSGESLEDILLFFKMARNGDFGDFYRLDAIVILSWIPKYLEIKLDAFHEERINQENQRIRQENDAVKNHVPTDDAKEKLEELSRKLKTTTISRNTGVLRSGNPMFDYQAYLDALPEAIKKADDKRLQLMIDNTSQYSHPEVYKILIKEKESRK